MCGFTCVFHPDAVASPAAHEVRNSLAASLEIIKHRGPDSRGIYVSPDARVGLGHVRLSIIDLSTGQQPLSDEDQLIHCVVTGEIYDHERIRSELEAQGYSFKSKSDSELVVQLYKRDGFNMVFALRGEFAFVLYDVERRLLFVARDRFGIKPLYYTIDNGRFLFASEMKAFMGLGWTAEWDIDSIVHSAELGDDRTVFKGVKKFPPGNFAICRATGSINVQPYWDLSYPPASAPPSTPIETMISTVREYLVEAVRLRLRSDVPLAVYLSGGIDSSAVAGIATHLLRESNPDAKLTTFTLAYPEDETTDEAPIAARTAAHLGAEAHVVNATEATLVDVLEDAIWYSEQPNTNFWGAGKILMSRAVRNKGYKVVLSGEGSDEVFAGYGTFLMDYLLCPDPAGAALGLELPSSQERQDMIADLEKNIAVPHISNMPTTFDNSKDLLLHTSSHHVATTLTPFSSPLFHPEVMRTVGSPNISRCIAEGLPPRARLNSITGNWHSLNLSLYITTKSLLSNVLLNQAGDRGDMANSVESRVSFLDHRLVEYINSLPPSVKIMPVAGNSPGKWAFTEKWILRQAVKPFVTEEIYLRKKAPFNPPPQPSATSGLVPLQAHLKARITQMNVERLGIFDWNYIQDTLNTYLDAPGFPAHGAIDHRARMLMGVLSFIVLQERFHVPTLKV
ncbi:putative asparagine synthase [Mycena rebaudengoi]|nr:putative asparagine synthase [Mycena rebaudengoi]